LPRRACKYAGIADKAHKDGCGCLSAVININVQCGQGTKQHDDYGTDRQKNLTFAADEQGRMERDCDSQP
jgi:hypothetical protein